MGGAVRSRRDRLSLGGRSLLGSDSRLGGGRLFSLRRGVGYGLFLGLGLLAPPAEQTLLLPGRRGLLVVVGTKHVGIESLGDATETGS